MLYNPSSLKSDHCLPFRVHLHIVGEVHFLVQCPGLTLEKGDFTFIDQIDFLCHLRQSIMLLFREGFLLNVCASSGHYKSMHYMNYD